MTERAGFQIGDEIFAIPTKYGFGDAEIVEEVCGIEFAEFAERLKDLNNGEKDAKALRGLIACSVRQRHPSWSLARVARFVRDIDFEDFGIVGGAEDAPEPGEPGPAQEPAEV